MSYVERNETIYVQTDLSGILTVELFFNEPKIEMCRTKGTICGLSHEKKKTNGNGNEDTF